MIKDNATALEYIETTLTTWLDEDWLLVGLEPLNLELFHSTPGSTQGHHKEYGGLLLHVAQVLRLALSAVEALDTENEAQNKFNRVCTCLAAVYHDVGKCYCYRPVYVGGGEKEFVDKATERTWDDMHIGHIVRSYEIFCEEVPNGLENDPVTKQVKHMILSHHGRREWGSPVEPQNCLARLFHQADDNSAKCFP